MTLDTVTGRRISLLSFDLDGTLLDQSGDIPPGAVKKIRAAMSLGVKVTLSSARVPAMEDAFVRQLGLTGPYMAANGALILIPGGMHIYSSPASGDVLARLRAFCAQSGLDLSLQTRRQLFYTPGNPRMAVPERYNRLAKAHGYPPAEIRNMSWDGSGGPTEPVYKALVWAPRQTAVPKLERWLSQEPRLAWAASEPGLYDVTSADADKGKGLERICRWYGFSPSQACVFGDYDNDLPIFRRAGVRIAMGNASEVLKKEADHITSSNNAGGVEEALDALWSCFPEQNPS